MCFRTRRKSIITYIVAQQSNFTTIWISHADCKSLLSPPLPSGCSITPTYHWANVPFSPFRPPKRLLPFSLPHQSLTEVKNRIRTCSSVFPRKTFLFFVYVLREFCRWWRFRYLVEISVKKLFIMTKMMYMETVRWVVATVLCDYHVTGMILQSNFPKGHRWVVNRWSWNRNLLVPYYVTNIHNRVLGIPDDCCEMIVKTNM